MNNLIAPAAALLGVLIALYWNGRLEKKRFANTREIDEIKWVREKEKIALELDHKSMIDLRERRIESYSQYNQLLNRSIKLCNQTLPAYEDKGSFDEIMEKWAELHAEGRQKVEEIRLICSDALRKEFGTQEALHALTIPISIPYLPGDLAGKPADFFGMHISRVQSIRSKALTHGATVTEIMRIELGITSMRGPEFTTKSDRSSN